jgi:phenylalanyl-tRNA synthetase beta chain
MLDQKSLQKTGVANTTPGIRIKNPLTNEQELMRPAILPSLLQIVLNNFNQGQKDLKLFEIGKNYEAGQEKEVLGLVLTGQSPSDWRENKKKDVDLYDLKGIFEAAFFHLGVQGIVFEAKDYAVFEKGYCFEIKKGNVSLGYAGEISLDIIERWGIKAKSVFCSFIELEAIYDGARILKSFESVSAYPAIVRDVSLAIKQNVSFDQIKTIAKRLGGKLLSSIRFNEEYIGEKIQAGYRGVIFSLVYQSSERTLREDDVQQVHNQICQTLVKELEAIIR